jgi:hypothetical protein
MGMRPGKPHSHSVYCSEDKNPSISIVYITLYGTGTFILMMLVWFITAWFMQWDGNVGIHQSDNILCGSSHSTVKCAHWLYCAHIAEMLFWIVVLSKARAEYIMLTSIIPSPTSNTPRLMMQTNPVHPIL